LLLDAWHEALSFTSSDLKVLKSYWTIQNYKWVNRVCKLEQSTSLQLVIEKEEKNIPIKFISLIDLRILVSVAITLSHSPLKIVPYFDKKIVEYKSSLSISSLSPSQLLNGYKACW